MTWLFWSIHLCCDITGGISLRSIPLCPREHRSLRIAVRLAPICTSLTGHGWMMLLRRTEDVLGFSSLFGRTMAFCYRLKDASPLRQQAKWTQKWTHNGPTMDPKWTRNGPEMDPKWTRNGPEMDPKWTQNGPKMDPKWTQNGPKMDPKWTQNGHGA